MILAVALPPGRRPHSGLGGAPAPEKTRIKHK